MTIDTDSLRESTDIAEVIGRYVELTKSGHEFTGLCPFHADKNPSFFVVPNKQFFHCFGCGAHGDVINFLQEYESLDFKTACERLGARDFHVTTRPIQSAAVIQPEWTPIIPIPHDAPQLFPKQNHTCRIYNPKRAGTDKEWTEFSPARHDVYRTKDGKIACFVLRVEFQDGSKFTPTVTFCQLGDERRWAIVPLPRPRLLYNLNLITDNPTKPVLIVEGEKTRAAAEILFPSYITTCWPGGANGVEYVDWQPLSGRDVVIWPDADDAGKRAVLGYRRGSNGSATMHQGIAHYLRPIATRMRWLDVMGQPEGWDADDALQDRWTPKQAAQWARERVQDVPDQLWEPPPKPLLDAPVKLAISKLETRPEPLASPRGTTPPAAAAPATNVIPIPARKSVPQSKSGLWEFLTLKTNSNGIPHRNVANAIRALQAHPETKGRIWFDEFYGSFFTDWDSPRHEWCDDDDLRLTVWLQDNLELIKVTDDLVHKAVTRIGHLNTRNEPKDWFSTLEWDNQPRVHTSFSRYFGAKQADYHDAVAANFWISMVARVMEPGCKVDNMIVLEAIQGARKSSALNVIGGKWYCEAHESVMSKDFFMALKGKLVVEIGELDSFSRAETTKVKQVITCRSDRYRAPYARATVDNPRQNVFAGTTNDDAYLRDATGARRFWPVRCQAIDIDGLAADRDQLFAEAIQLHKEGHTWWETPPGQAELQQEHRRDQDAWEEPLRQYLAGRNETTLNEVLEILDIKTSDASQREGTRIGKVLRVLGWDKHTVRRDGRQLKLWKPKPETKAGNQTWYF